MTLTLTLNQRAALQFAILEDSKRDATAKRELEPILALLDGKTPDQDIIIEVRRVWLLRPDAPYLR